jgi:hypothetical protein
MALEHLVSCLLIQIVCFKPKQILLLSVSDSRSLQNFSIMKISCAIILLLSLHLYADANVVSINTARTVALNFYQSTTGSQTSPTASLMLVQSESDGTVDFYVFDIGVAGFVIVSAADNVPPVLGYSTETNFATGIPEIGIKGWLNHTALDIHQAVIRYIPAAAHSAALWSQYLSSSQVPAGRSIGIGPLLTTTWGQAPYSNTLCPYDNTNQAKSVTGCLATAMAQIMKLWSFPARGVGSYSYVDSQSHAGYSLNIGRISADFAATAYQWSQMPSTLTTDNAAVSTLMYQCGVSMAMNYTARGSSAYMYYTGHPSTFTAFTEYFSYDAHTMQFVEKANYTSADWQTMIENELNQGRPILYSGQDTGNIGGHAWVCDGYDAGGMLHMNWGWGGMDNGYFLTTDLNPGAQNWTWSQAALIGIQPDPSALSVNNVSENLSFKLYPNPASDRITIAGNNTGTATDYTIYDIAGHNVSRGRMTDSETIETLGWAPGIYFAKLQNDRQQSTHTFIVGK